MLQFQAADVENEIIRERASLDSLKDEYQGLVRELNTTRLEEEQHRSLHRTRQNDLQDAWEKLCTLRTHISALRRKFDDAVVEGVVHNNSNRASLDTFENSSNEQKPPSNSYILNTKMRLRDDLIDQLAVQEGILKELRRQIELRSTALISRTSSSGLSSEGLSKSIEESLRLRQGLVKVAADLERAEADFMELSARLDSLKIEIKQSVTESSSRPRSSADSSADTYQHHYTSSSASTSAGAADEAGAGAGAGAEAVASSRAEFSLYEVLAGEARVVRMNGEHAAAFRTRLEKRLHSLLVLERQLQEDLDEKAHSVRRAKDELRDCELRRLRLELQLSNLSGAVQHKESQLVAILNSPKVDPSKYRVSDAAIVEMKAVLGSRYGDVDSPPGKSVLTTADVRELLYSPPTPASPALPVSPLLRQILDFPSIYADEKPSVPPMNRPAVSPSTAARSAETNPRLPPNNAVASQRSKQESSTQTVHAVFEQSRVAAAAALSATNGKVDVGVSPMHIRDPLESGLSDREVSPATRPTLVVMTATSEVVHAVSRDDSTDCADIVTRPTVEVSTRGVTPVPQPAGRSITEDTSVADVLPLKQSSFSPLHNLRPLGTRPRAAERPESVSLPNGEASAGYFDSFSPSVTVAATSTAAAKAVSHPSLIPTPRLPAKKSPSELALPAPSSNSIKTPSAVLGRYASTESSSCSPDDLPFYTPHAAPMHALSSSLPTADKQVLSTVTPANVQLSSIQDSHLAASADYSDDPFHTLQRRYLNRQSSSEATRLFEQRRDPQLLRQSLVEFNRKMKLENQRKLAAKKIQPQPHHPQHQPQQQSVPRHSTTVPTPSTASSSRSLETPASSTLSAPSERSPEKPKTSLVATPDRALIEGLPQQHPHGILKQPERAAEDDSWSSVLDRKSLVSAARHLSGASPMGGSTLQRSPPKRAADLPASPLATASSQASSSQQQPTHVHFDASTSSQQQQQQLQQGPELIPLLVARPETVVEDVSVNSSDPKSSTSQDPELQRLRDKVTTLQQKVQGAGDDTEPEVGRLSVLIVSAKNLPQTKRFTRSADPYVYVTMDSGAGGSSGSYNALDCEERPGAATAIQWGNTSPTWVEHFSLEEVAVLGGSVQFLVMDASRSGDSDLIGRCAVSLRSLADQKRHSLQLPIQFVDQRAKRHVKYPAAGSCFLKVELRLHGLRGQSASRHHELQAAEDELRRYIEAHPPRRTTSITQPREQGGGEQNSIGPNGRKNPIVPGGSKYSGISRSTLSMLTSAEEEVPSRRRKTLPPVTKPPVPVTVNVLTSVRVPSSTTANATAVRATASAGASVVRDDASSRSGDTSSLSFKQRWELLNSDAFKRRTALFASSGKSAGTGSYANKYLKTLRTSS